jgi:hypothetical protein
MTTTTIAQEIVAASKQGTTTYGEALQKLGYLSTRSNMPTQSHIIFNAAYTMLLDEMKAMPHSIDPTKPYD